MASSALVHLKERMESLRKSASNVRIQAKAVTHEIVGTALAGATCGALGALDQSKGTIPASDTTAQIATYNVGPVPASLAVAAAGKVAAVMMMGDEAGRLASAVGQGGLDAWAYVMGRRLWANHSAGK